MAAAGVAWGGALTLQAPAPDERVTAAILPLDIRTYRDAPVNEVGPDIALAPDGSFLVYVGPDPESRTGTALWRRPLDGLEATMIPGTRGAFWPLVSSDGLSVLYQKRSAAGTTNDMWKVALDGGLPTRAPMDWVPLRDGRSLVVADSGLEIVRGTPRDIDPSRGLAFQELRGLLSISVSPDFRYLAHGARDSIIVRTPDGGFRAVVATGSSPTFLDNDLLAFRATDGTLQAGRLSADRSRFTAPPVTVVPAVMASGSGAGVYSVGHDGTLVYRPGTASGESRLVWVDASGRESPVPNANPRIYNGVALSPDERRVALSAGTVGRTSDVWLTDLVTGATTPLTRDGLSSRAAWRSDNRTLSWLHFAVATPAGRGRDAVGLGSVLPAAVPIVSIRNVDASAGEDSLPGPWPRRVDELAWSPDEQFVAIRTTEAGTRNIYIRRLAADSLVPFAAEPAQERGPSFSPDGRWLLYVSDRSGRDEVYAESFPGGGNRTQISLDGAREAAWSRDGSRVFFRGLDGWMTAAHVSRGAALTVERLERLFDATPYHANQFLRMYDVSRDGRFLMLKSEASGPRTDVVIIRNWVRQVKRQLGQSRD
ncbi:MAG: PD40 domain-containing protein [Gemmatimonadaceae bacterium]|nr:PD40 domain-containing protein [Gemmatimonadaceae bacterium]